MRKYREPTIPDGKTLNPQQLKAEVNLKFYGVTGSHAYGMNTPTSDIDYRGIFNLTCGDELNPFFSLDQVEGFRGQKDSVVYNLNKYLILLVEQNPNIMELLWLEEDEILYRTPMYDKLRTYREELLSKKAKHSFSGYAHSQLKRIKGHNKWINNPQPERRPKEADFLSVVWNATEVKEWNKKVPLEGFTAYDLGGNIIGLVTSPTKNLSWIDRHEALILNSIKDIGEEVHVDFKLLVKFNKQLYMEAVDNWKHYWGWKKNRNETRSELEEKYGYDTKHASHLIRLLRMGREILLGRGVLVRRPDAAELLDIRNGKRSYEDIMKESTELDKELESLYISSTLRHTIDMEKLGKFIVDLKVGRI